MLKKIVKYSSIMAIVSLLLLSIFIAFVYYGAFGKLHTIKQLQEFKNQTATLVLSEEGDLIGKYFAENRTNIKYKQLPKHLIDALVATEDARYFKHVGIDSRSLLRVVFKTILSNNRSSGGGSTINQQLVKNMYGRNDYSFLSIPVNKAKEAFLAYRLGKVYTKQEILTLYFNTVPFGENVLGIEAASRRFFNKSIDKVKIDEAAILVGMLKANTYYNPRMYPEHAIKRRNVVFSQMKKYDFISVEEFDSLKQLPLKLNYANLDNDGPANYFLVQVKKEAKEIIKHFNENNETDYKISSDGLIITTTLSNSLQKQALKVFKGHLSKMQKQLSKQYNKGYYKKQLDKLVKEKIKKLKLTNVSKKKKRILFSWDGFYSDSISKQDSLRHSMSLLQAGLLAINPENGAIKTWVGGIDFKTQKYDQIFAQRQLASTFKPILYAAALEQGMMPCNYLKNDSIIFPEYDNWFPKNYDNSFGGEYSMAASLSKSKNIPTVDLFMKTPFAELRDVWNNLGFSQKLFDNPSVALGASSASIYELAIAYSAFANGGFKIKPQIISTITTADGKVIYKNDYLKEEKEQVLSTSSTQLLTAMLQKAVNKGTGIAVRERYGITIPLAAKTGTSQNYADAWFAAYTPKLVLVSRVGATSPKIHFSNGANGSGSRLALPLVAKTLEPFQKKYAGDFSLSEELLTNLECDDYRIVSDLQLIIDDLFKKNGDSIEDIIRRAKKKLAKDSLRTLRKNKRDSSRLSRKEKRSIRRAKRKADGKKWWQF